MRYSRTMRWMGTRISLSMCLLVVWFATQPASAQFGVIQGIPRTPIRCAAAYGAGSGTAVQPIQPAEMKQFKIIEWSLNAFRIRNAGAYAAKTDWRDHRRPRSIQNNEHLKEGQLRTIKNSILKLNPDVLLLTEILDLASIRMFANDPKYLNGAYEVYVHPENQFGSNIGFLVKKGLPLKFEFETHAHVHRVDELGEDRRAFTRDVPVLIMRPLNDSHLDRVAVLIGVHAKSPRKVEGRASIGSERIRLYEFQGYAQIAANYRQRFPNAAIGILGDINVDVQNDKAMEILKGEMESFMDLAGVPKGDPSRFTRFGFTKDAAFVADQSDDFLMNGNFFNYYLSGRVVPFLDISGNARKDPMNGDERDQNPTDHKMIELIFDFFSFFFGKES